MDASVWLIGQLQSSLETCLWAVQQNPAAHWYVASPRRPDDWPIARTLLHLVAYEQRFALPSVRQWLDGPKPEVGEPADETALEDARWNAGPPDGAMLCDELHTARTEQIALLAQLAPDVWNEMRPAIWGTVSLRWVVTKTLQHTFEHTDPILRTALWWRE